MNKLAYLEGYMDKMSTGKESDIADQYYKNKAMKDKAYNAKYSFPSYDARRRNAAAASSALNLPAPQAPNRGYDNSLPKPAAPRKAMVRPMRNTPARELPIRADSNVASYTRPTTPPQPSQATPLTPPQPSQATPLTPPQPSQATSTTQFSSSSPRLVHGELVRQLGRVPAGPVKNTSQPLPPGATRSVYNFPAGKLQDWLTRNNSLSGIQNSVRSLPDLTPDNTGGTEKSWTGRLNDVFKYNPLYAAGKSTYNLASDIAGQKKGWQGRISQNLLNTNPLYAAGKSAYDAIASSGYPKKVMNTAGKFAKGMFSGWNSPTSSNPINRVVSLMNPIAGGLLNSPTGVNLSNKVRDFMSRGNNGTAVQNVAPISN